MPGPVRKPTRRSTSLLFIALFLTLATVIGLASYGVRVGSLALSGVQRVARTLGGAVSAATDSVAAYGGLSNVCVECGLIFLRARGMRGLIGGVEPDPVTDEGVEPVARGVVVL